IKSESSFGCEIQEPKEILTQENDPIALSKIMLNSEETPSDEIFSKLIILLLQIKEAAGTGNSFENLKNAALLAKTASYIDGYSKSTQLAKQILLATNLPLDLVEYSSQSLSSAFPNS